MPEITGIFLLSCTRWRKSHSSVQGQQNSKMVSLETLKRSFVPAQINTIQMTQNKVYKK